MPSIVIKYSGKSAERTFQTRNNIIFYFYQLTPCFFKHASPAMICVSRFENGEENRQILFFVDSFCFKADLHGTTSLHTTRLRHAYDMT